MFNQIMEGQSWKKPFVSKAEVKEWCKDNQPYYKKHIPDVCNHFIKKAGL
jgi:IS1 family transposase